VKERTELVALVRPRSPAPLKAAGVRERAAARLLTSIVTCAAQVHGMRREAPPEFPRPLPFMHGVLAPGYTAPRAAGGGRAGAGAGGARRARGRASGAGDAARARAEGAMEAVVRLDESEVAAAVGGAAGAAVAAHVRGLAALLRTHFALLADAAARGQPVSGLARVVKGEPPRWHRSPLHLDWHMPDFDDGQGQGAATGGGGGEDGAGYADALRKGGALYELARAGEPSGALVPGARYAFQRVPLRVFEYVRFDAGGAFVDRSTPAPSGPVLPCHATPCRSMPCPAIIQCPVLPSFKAIPSHAIPCHARRCARAAHARAPPPPRACARRALRRRGGAGRRLEEVGGAVGGGDAEEAEVRRVADRKALRWGAQYLPDPEPSATQLAAAAPPQAPPSLPRAPAPASGVARRSRLSSACR
jgi:hypothetical protein